MSELITLTALLLISGMFMATLILGRVAQQSRKERDGWMNGFAYLNDNPHDLEGAFRVIARTNPESRFSLLSAAIFKEREKK